MGYRGDSFDAYLAIGHVVPPQVDQRRIETVSEISYRSKVCGTSSKVVDYRRPGLCPLSLPFISYVQLNAAMSR